MLPVPPAMPAELAAEVTGVASVEIKLIAELHEVYGLRPAGNFRQRGMACLMSWTEERGVDLTKPASLNIALGVQMRRELRQQIMKRTLRNLPNLAPFMIGASVGAFMNRRDTRKLAEKIRKDLRTKQIPWEALPPPRRTPPRAANGPGKPRPHRAADPHPRAPVSPVRPPAPPPGAPASASRDRRTASGPADR